MLNTLLLYNNGILFQFIFDLKIRKFQKQYRENVGDETFKKVILPIAQKDVCRIRNVSISRFQRLMCQLELLIKLGKGMSQIIRSMKWPAAKL